MRMWRCNFYWSWALSARNRARHFAFAYVALATACAVVLSVGCSPRPAPGQLPIVAKTTDTPDRPAKSPADPGPLWLGIAREDISPDRPVIMGGYGMYMFSRALCRWSRGTHDPLYATALYLAKGDTELVIIHADLVGLGQPDIFDIRTRVSRRLSIPVEHVIVAASHTHQSPDTVGLWGTIIPTSSGRDADYMREMRGRAADAAVEAYLARRSARLAFATGQITDMHRNTYDEQIKAPFIDHTVTALYARDAATDEVIATLTNWGCHPTTEGPPNRLISADYVGAYYRAIARDGGGMPMFINASIGAAIQPDENWFKAKHPGKDSQGFTWATAMGEELARRVFSLKAGARELPVERIGVAERNFHVPMLSETYDLARKMDMMPNALPALGEEYHTLVTAVDLGALQIGTMPGEMSPQLGRQIRAALGGEAQILVGLGQDWVGYLIDRDQYENPMYAYEKMLCLSPWLGEAAVSAHDALRVEREAARAKSPAPAPAY
ncbi:MAG: hypothetical protein IT350_05160 [Deltaproteobacteria bacterium]|nr:hypothetical protein [Deltaproteobacteria bacterium]